MKEWITNVGVLILILVSSIMIAGAIHYCFLERSELKTTIAVQESLIIAYREVKEKQDSIIDSYRIKEMYEVTNATEQ